MTTKPLVVQVLPLLVNDAGALKFAFGSVIVVVIGTVVGPVPLFVTVIGTLLGEPATKLGEGWPMTVVKSGAATAFTVMLPLSVCTLKLLPLRPAFWV